MGCGVWGVGGGGGEMKGVGCRVRSVKCEVRGRAGWGNANPTCLSPVQVCFAVKDHMGKVPASRLQPVSKKEVEEVIARSKVIIQSGGRPNRVFYFSFFITLDPRAE